MQRKHGDQRAHGLTTAAVMDMDAAGFSAFVDRVIEECDDADKQSEARDQVRALRRQARCSPFRPVVMHEIKQSGIMPGVGDSAKTA